MSASRTTFAHGRGQAAGGANWYGFGEKSAKLTPVKSGTTHGVVRGRGTGMSAVAVFELPTVALCAARLVEVDARSSMRDAAFATRAVRASVTSPAAPRVAPA